MLLKESKKIKIENAFLISSYFNYNVHTTGPFFFRKDGKFKIISIGIIKFSLSQIDRNWWMNGDIIKDI